MTFDKDKHIVYEGQEFCIEWYVDVEGKSHALDYADEMSANYIGKFMHLLEVMGDIGRIHDKTKFRNEGDKIYAFKPQPYRFLCFFTVDRRIIITNGFYKDQDKLPQAEKDRAVKAMEDYFKRVAKGDYYA
jgi:phage-related protein